LSDHPERRRVTANLPRVGSTVPLGMLADHGRVLGKYQLVAEIARGGMGIVYLAMVQGPGGFNKLVVVKELKPELVEEPAFLTMFLDEARLAARLSHPNIVQTNEVGNAGDRYFMAMDYLDGRGLDQIRRRTRHAGYGLSAPMQLRVICDMLAGLDYAHNLTDFDGSPLHIVHRDVSPQNVFVTFDGQVKLLDFGIAKATDSVHETHAGVVKGKVAYMSPEQGRGWKVDARSDVFSAGVMLWEALTGKRMRDGKNEQEKMWALVSADVPRPSSVKAWVPPELDEICARAMAWERDDRYPSAGALQADLEAYLRKSGSNVTARDVGACVSDLFREDRASTNAVIEAHVARFRGGGGVTRDQLPIIEIASRSGGPSPTPSNDAGVRPRTETGLQTSLDAPSARGSDAPPPAIPETQPVRTRNLRSVMIAGVTGVVVAAVVIMLVARATRDATTLTAGREPAPMAMPVTPPPAAAPAPAPAAKPAAPEPRPAPPTVPATIDVEIRVEPATARLSIDGTEVDGNPFVSRYTRDDEVHHVRATAPGYLAKSMQVSFAANVTLAMTLERVAPAPRPVAIQRPRPAPRAPDPDPAPAAAPRAPTDVDPNGGTKPRRPIDPTNPYGGSGE
jgi:serine/threonine-protein kinase